MCLLYTICIFTASRDSGAMNSIYNGRPLECPGGAPASRPMPTLALTRPCLTRGMAPGRERLALARSKVARARLDLQRVSAGCLGSACRLSLDFLDRSDPESSPRVLGFGSGSAAPEMELDKWRVWPLGFNTDQPMLACMPACWA